MFAKVLIFYYLMSTLECGEQGDALNAVDKQRFILAALAKELAEKERPESARETRNVKRLREELKDAKEKNRAAVHEVAQKEKLIKQMLERWGNDEKHNEELESIIGRNQIAISEDDKELKKKDLVIAELNKQIKDAQVALRTQKEDAALSAQQQKESTLHLREQVKYQEGRIKELQQEPSKAEEIARLDEVSRMQEIQHGAALQTQLDDEIQHGAALQKKLDKETANGAALKEKLDGKDADNAVLQKKLEEQTAIGAALQKKLDDEGLVVEELKTKHGLFSSSGSVRLVLSENIALVIIGFLFVFVWIFVIALIALIVHIKKQCNKKSKSNDSANWLSQNQFGMPDNSEKEKSFILEIERDAAAIVSIEKESSNNNFSEEEKWDCIYNDEIDGRGL